jgi:hypothetical protein
LIGFEDGDTKKEIKKKFRKQKANKAKYETFQTELDSSG